MPADGGLDDGVDVLEDVSFREDVAARADFEGVAGVVVPVVVDLRKETMLVGVSFLGAMGVSYGVQEGASLDLGRTTAGVVDVVALQRDVVVGAVQVNSPVVIAVAGGRVTGRAVDVAVGDGHALGGLGAEDNVLAANAGGGNVVDPDHVAIVDGDGITAPDVLGVDISDGDVPSAIAVSGKILSTHLEMKTYWMMMLLAPLTIRRPLPLITPEEPEPMMVLWEATVIPRTPALSLVECQYIRYPIPPRGRMIPLTRRPRRAEH